MILSLTPYCNTLATLPPLKVVDRNKRKQNTSYLLIKYSSPYLLHLVQCPIYGPSMEYKEGGKLHEASIENLTKGLQ